jgi:hypothetical protein
VKDQSHRLVVIALQLSAGEGRRELLLVLDPEGDDLPVLPLVPKLARLLTELTPLRLEETAGDRRLPVGPLHTGAHLLEGPLRLGEALLIEVEATGGVELLQLGVDRLPGGDRRDRLLPVARLGSGGLIGRGLRLGGGDVSVLPGEGELGGDEEEEGREEGKKAARGGGFHGKLLRVARTHGGSCGKSVRERNPGRAHSLHTFIVRGPGWGRF